MVRNVKMTAIYQVDQVQLNPSRITEYDHKVFGKVTVFHDVVIASELVQPYEDGRAYKCRDELESYAWTVDGRWVMIGAHPAEGIISERDQVQGRTVNPRYVKDLLDPKTKRPNRAGVRADVEIFNDKTPPETLKDMCSGKKQDVSIAFFHNKDSTAGTIEDGPCKGDSYDYVQRNMFHDHLAAGLDNGDGRCTMPYCGLGADEFVKQIAGDPFAGFSSFSDCVAEMMKPKDEGGEGYSEETAEKVCGRLKEEHEDTVMEETLLVKAKDLIKILLEEEYEALRGLKYSKLEAEVGDWWRRLDWSVDANRTFFDTLPEETRILIIDAGLCPECDEEEGEGECEEGYHMNEEGECVPMEESEEEEDDGLPFEDGDALDFKLVPVDSKESPKLNPFEVLERANRVLK